MTKSTKVGYGNPPDSGKFKPKQSGNPGGRRKRPNRDFDETIIALVDGLLPGQDTSVLEALLKKLLAMAAKGDIDSIKLLLTHYFKAKERAQEPSLRQ